MEGRWETRKDVYRRARHEGGGPHPVIDHLGRTKKNWERKVTGEKRLSIDVSGGTRLA